MEVIKRNDLTIVPMISGGKSYGQIIVDHRSAESALADTHVAELLTFASAAGVAVSRQDLREKLNERSEELASAIWRQELAHKQLLRSERLASVGKMAAGAAHEINNPLAVISGRAQMLLKTEKDEKRASSLKLIVEQTHRASKILTDLMGFARPAMPKAEPVNLNTIIHQVLSMVENQLRLKNIEVARDLAEGLPRILADRRQLEQVFLNLVLNADHAMEDGGVLTVRTSLSKDGKQVVAKFTDTGVGIPKEHLAQIFEPFYTTKEEGKGTGLGLSMSYGIIKSHEGTIAADSAEGKGTTFTIKLPVPVDLKAAVEPEKPEPPPQAKGETSGSATILVVDDEEYIRDILSETFKACGYRMLSAANGVEALKILNKESVDVVLLDMRMPMKDGLSVVKEIADRLPTLPVIIVTGLASDDEVKEAEKVGVFSCIRKPFEIQKLIEEVQKALKKKGSEPAD
jgi:signal transduction histidine kinase/ActR/RegA family two-component response regulator